MMSRQLLKVLCVVAMAAFALVTEPEAGHAAVVTNRFTENFDDTILASGLSAVDEANDPNLWPSIANGVADLPAPFDGPYENGQGNNAGLAHSIDDISNVLFEPFPGLTASTIIEAVIFDERNPRRHGQQIFSIENTLAISFEFVAPGQPRWRLRYYGTDPDAPAPANNVIGEVVVDLPGFGIGDSFNSGDHIALVFTNTGTDTFFGEQAQKGFIDVYLNGDSILSLGELGQSIDIQPDDLQLTFGYSERGFQSGRVWDGSFEAIAVSTFTGVFDPATDFQLSQGTRIRNPADLRGDGAVDGFDLARWEAGFGGTIGLGDVDGDGDGDGSDFLTWQREFGKVATASPLASAVPEPSSMLMAVSFLVGVFLQKRSRWS